MHTLRYHLTRMLQWALTVGVTFWEYYFADSLFYVWCTMIMRSNRVACCSVTFILMICATPYLIADDDRTSAGRAATIGYGANLRSFTQYNCKVTLKQGTATSVAAAKSGTYSVNTACDATLIVDGNNMRIESHGLPFDEGMKKVRPKKTGKVGLSTVAITFCLKETFLSNGTEDLAYTAGGNLAINIFKPDLPGTPSECQPLATGLFDTRLRNTPDRMITTPDAYLFVGEGFHTLEGRATVRVKFVDKRSPVVWQIDYDVARGYLPIRIARWVEPTKDGEPRRNVHEVWVTEVKDCGKGRFFPTRHVLCYVPDAPGSKVSVSELVVRSVDPDYEPTVEDFTFTLPAGLPVIFFRSNQAPKFTPRQDETITPADLPKLFEMVELKQRDPLADTALPRERTRWWLWIGFGLLTVGASALVLRRVLRRRASEG